MNAFNEYSIISRLVEQLLSFGGQFVKMDELGEIETNVLAN